MKVDKEIIKMDGYINFKVKGIIDNLNFNKELLEVFYKIDNSALKYNCKKVLLDVIDLDYDITDFDRYKIGEMIASSYKKNFIRIACLRCKDIINDFTEVVAFNRGAYFKFFNDEKDAINWLKK